MTVSHIFCATAELGRFQSYLMKIHTRLRVEEYEKQQPQILSLISTPLVDHVNKAYPSWELSTTITILTHSTRGGVVPRRVWHSYVFACYFDGRHILRDLHLRMLTSSSNNVITTTNTTTSASPKWALLGRDNGAPTGRSTGDHRDKKHRQNWIWLFCSQLFWRNCVPALSRTLSIVLSAVPTLSTV